MNMNAEKKWLVSQLVTTNMALDDVNAELAALKVRHATAVHEHECQRIGQENRLKYQCDNLTNTLVETKKMLANTLIDLVETKKMLAQTEVLLTRANEKLGPD